MTEYMEYAKLLRIASEQSDPIERLKYVSAFAVSALASNWERLGKPFNPLLGETYELTRPEFRIICEQVSYLLRSDGNEGGIKNPYFAGIAPPTYFGVPCRLGKFFLPRIDSSEAEILGQERGDPTEGNGDRRVPQTGRSLLVVQCELLRTQYYCGQVMDRAVRYDGCC